MFILQTEPIYSSVYQKCPPLIFNVNINKTLSTLSWATYECVHIFLVFGFLIKHKRMEALESGTIQFSCK